MTPSPRMKMGGDAVTAGGGARRHTRPVRAYACAVSTSTERMRRMRERRRLALQPPEDEPPQRDPGELLLPAVRESVADLGLDESAAGAVRIAEAQARIIDRARDQAWALRWHGPLLMQALNDLGATPLARARMRKPVPPRGPNRLDQLRQARADQHPL
jgi:hypothetical protein